MNIAGGAVLETERLRLQPVLSADACWLHSHWNLSGVRRWLWDDLDVPMDRVVGEIEASDAHFAAEGFGMWLLHPMGAFATEVRTDGPIGTCGLHSDLCDAEALGWPCEMVEVVFTIDPSLWGRGLAGEAAGAILRHGHDACGIEIIGGGHDRGNVASGRVLRRIGMEPFGSVPSVLGPADYLIHRASRPA